MASGTIYVLLFSFWVVLCDGSKDYCSLCARGNSSCRTVSGLFTRPQLPLGYNLITQLPEEACNLTISQIKHTDNFLALRRPDGSYVLNGDWEIGWSGDVETAGMKFVYSRDDGNTMETIYSAGPLRETIDLMLIYQEPNPGVKYQYQFPMLRPGVLSNSLTLSSKHYADEKSENNEIEMQRPSDHFFPFIIKNKSSDTSEEVTLKAKHKIRRRKVSWKVVGFTECSKPCGGGIKTAVILCVRENNQMPVPESRCAVHQKPLVPTIQCNIEPCAAEWVAGKWSDCSVSCGEGLQTRDISCKQDIYPGIPITVAAEVCSTPIPMLLMVTRNCHQPPCLEHKPFQSDWQIGPWSMCSVTCGMGIMSRTVHCPVRHCSNEQPPTQSVCDMGLCTSDQAYRTSYVWLFTEWSQQCSESCGTGVQTRQVKCSGSEHLCDKSLKPDGLRNCYSDKQCNGQWYSGPWGQCSVKCGKGKQQRSIICIRKQSGEFAIILESHCLSKEKPMSEQHCYTDEACGAEWFTTEWSQCVGDCENGVQMREVQCLDDNLMLSNDCAENKKPMSQRECVHSHCKHSLLDNSIAGNRFDHLQFFSGQSNNNGETEDCEDVFHNCNLVVQARLCKYKYYNTSCCKSCHH